jgi:hypothetical protein
MVAPTTVPYVAPFARLIVWAAAKASFAGVA